jgi:alkylation response protein AidB-like acyl-CoA dehydrogenase
MIFPAQRHGSIRAAHFGQTTQIYEGTNQIQRVVMAKHILK